MAKLSQTFAATSLSWLALSTAASAQAVPVHHEFAVHWTSGELAGQTTTGRFAYDSTWAVPNALWQAEGLLTSLQLTLRGEAFDTRNANANYLAFDAQGRLSGVVIGTTCNWTTCWVSADDRNTWWLNWQNVSGHISGQAVAADGLGELSWADVTMLNSVPEPQSAALLVLGLGALAAARLVQLRRRPPIDRRTAVCRANQDC